MLRKISIWFYGSLLMLFLSAGWLFTDFGWEPLLVCLASFGTALRLIFYKQKSKDITISARRLDYLKVFLIVVSLLAGFLLSIPFSSNSATDKIHEDISTRSLESNRDNGYDPASAVDSGFTIFGAFMAYSIEGEGKKYLLDYGESMDSNRISLYFDEEGNLVFRVINEFGLTFTTVAPNTSYMYHVDVPFFVYCDVGVSEDYSYMRIMVNNRELMTNKSENKVNYIDSRYFEPRYSAYSVRQINKFKDGFVSKNRIGKFFNEKGRGMVCADIAGNYIANFHLMELQAGGYLLQRVERNRVWAAVRDKIFDWDKWFNRQMRPLNTPYEIIKGDLRMKIDSGSSIENGNVALQKFFSQ